MNKTIWEFEHSIECNSERSFVWSFWTDVSNWERLEGKAVEWIKIEGAFVQGASGSTKTPGKDAHNWTITQLEPQCFAVIEIPLEGAVFINKMEFVPIDSGRTRITQHFSLYGAKAVDFVEGIQMLETSAPLGLKKLVQAIESVYPSL
ncbi:hypothetical protein [Flagellimonas flava]|uniref:Polyketide cyclase / dehydrase and lipid transport n=1 Tax=Flagellimonas flava TaxID=570519 RepID=A0A1M5P7Y9_9FLAO|nr:hypothetical protein [Allomuricauda flava]SHG97916.1 hypothetical protein SAMN04488116_3124 [Allomuricauda flava]